MKTINKRVALILLLVSLAACTVVLPTPVSAIAQQYLNGGPTTAWALSDKQIDSLKSWLSRHPNGWYPSYVSYAPCMLIYFNYVDGKQSSVNVCPSGLVVVVSEEGQFTQKFEAKAVEQLALSVGANAK